MYKWELKKNLAFGPSCSSSLCYISKSIFSSKFLQSYFSIEQNRKTAVVLTLQASLDRVELSAHTICPWAPRVNASALGSASAPSLAAQHTLRFYSCPQPAHPLEPGRRSAVAPGNLCGRQHRSRALLSLWIGEVHQLRSQGLFFHSGPSIPGRTGRTVKGKTKSKRCQTARGRMLSHLMAF